jgi:VWFA-related protein
MSKPTIVTFAAVMAFAVFSSAQQSAPSPSPATKPQDSPASASQGQKPAYGTSAILKVKTRLVVVDVIARDSKGLPVTDLKQEDFTVLEDGMEQKVRIFNFQKPDATPAGARPLPASASNMVDNLPHFESGRALNVILMDALNTTRLNQISVRDSMVKFLEKLPENEPIAVYLLNDKLRLVQDFTTDPAVLKNVVRSFKGNKSPYLNVSADGSAISPVLPGISSSLPAQVALQIKQFQEQLTASMTDQRVQITLSALNSLARTLSGYPGRKNLIWVSESFPFDVLLTSAAGRASLTDRHYMPEIARTGNLLSDSQVAIYPLDAGGLAGMAMVSSPDPIGDNLAGNQGTDRLESHATMNDLAERTGGRAFYNRNNLEAALHESIDDGSTYYTLGYYPENKDWNGAFRKIQIKSHRAGLKLRFRIGYFAADSATFAKLSPKKQDEDFDEALTLNFPISTALPFKAMVLPPSAQTGSKVLVNFGADPHALSFSENAEGLKQVNMECAVRVFAKKNPDKPLATEARKMGGALTADGYAKVMAGYFPCRDEFNLKPGDYILRLGVRDNETGLIGTANAALTVPAEGASATPPAGERKP